jgi:hypothetical protein
MTLVIRPNEGVGEITFGMSQQEVRRAMGGMNPLLKATDSSIPADFYPDRSMIIHYSADGVVEAIEIGGERSTTLMNRTLIGQPFDEILQWMRSIDPRTEADEAGLTSFRFGVGVYAPHAVKSPQDPVEGVIAFRPGYYS